MTAMMNLIVNVSPMRLETKSRAVHVNQKKTNVVVQKPQVLASIAARPVFVMMMTLVIVVAKMLSMMSIARMIRMLMKTIVRKTT